MSFSEIIIIAVVAVLVLGPEKLPSTLVELAKLIKGIKKQINEAKRAVEDEINIAELREEAERYKREIAAANESVRKRLSLEDFEQIGEQVRGAGEQLRKAGEQVREGLASARAAGASAFAAAAQAAEANVLPDGGSAGGAAGGAGGGAEGAIAEETAASCQPGSRRAAWKQAALAIGNDTANADSDDVDGAAASDAQVSPDAGDFGFALLAELRCAPLEGRPERVSDDAGGVSEQAPGGASAVREQISATNETISDAADVDGNGNSAVVGDSAGSAGDEENFRKNADIEKLVTTAADANTAADAIAAAGAQTPTTQENPHA